ncbi:hypothetical protein E4U58_000243 [Claviceps cyperi]|nr:hypothetical protein E4U58_000243 [Claviceps cyperi]
MGIGPFPALAVDAPSHIQEQVAAARKWYTDGLPPAKCSREMLPRPDPEEIWGGHSRGHPRIRHKQRSNLTTE